ncbi:MAG: bifunctional glutamate N-acetyltransferase/amino-acid acetyltransferase ArgJ [Bryobacterales bacterium]|nr:bifunctional glutamate N-acetyltransferase/amino-acid acetyltransferase ArgJ [Bryobacterales bacterium]
MSKESIETPLGYRFAATYAGIHKRERDDLSLIVSDSPSNAAALFTTNRVKAAPLLVSMEHLDASKGKVSAVVINAGNANCATRTGLSVARETAAVCGSLLNVPPEQVLPSSTGVIGMELDVRKITANLPRLVETLSPAALPRIARAIMTTDTVPKLVSRRVRLAGGTVRLAGITKGAGMIHPNMATTLSFVMTDASLPVSALKRLLKEGADQSYHCISVDGDMSTNDTLLLLANGASGVKVTKDEEPAFRKALFGLLRDLAKMIARDGEGASHLMTIRIRGARTDAEARRIGRSIANSPLVKTAVAGCDPNWGRILSAAGYSGVEFDPGTVSIRLQKTLVCRNGLLAPFEEPPLIAKLREPEVEIDFRIAGDGKGECTFWTCDFTEDYVKINAEYRS